MKIKEWLCNGNDCSKCKWCWEVKTSYEYDEWDCGCYIKGEDFDDKPCYLINPFKAILGTLSQRKAEYYLAHEWDGFMEFSEDLDRKNDKLYELVMEYLIGENAICWRDKDGGLHEYDTKQFVKTNIWEVRSQYEDFAHPIIHKKLSEEWKELIAKTFKRFKQRTIGRIIPYFYKVK